MVRTRNDGPGDKSEFAIAIVAEPVGAEHAGESESEHAQPESDSDNPAIDTEQSEHGDTARRADAQHYTASAAPGHAVSGFHADAANDTA